MARICPNCGRPALDDQSQFCNKCGSPFAEDQPKKILVRTTPRLADTPPPPPAPVAPPAAEYYAPPVRSYADPPRVRAPAPRPAAQPKPAGKSPLPFKKLIGRDFIRPVYWLGVIAILLVVFAGITAELPKTDTTAGTPAEDTAGAGSGDFLSDIPLFWIGIFIFTNLLWRVVCEMSAVLFALRDAGASPYHDRGPGFDSLLEDEMPESWDNRAEEPVTCPRCGRVVPAGELRTCEHCGVEGCSNCIRLMGLLKKTLTCKDCFERK